MKEAEGRGSLFVSYETETGLKYAREAKRVFTEAGYRVWMWESDSRPGAYPIEEIARNIQACGAFVYLCTAAEPDGEPRRNGQVYERSMAWQLNKQCIVFTFNPIFVPLSLTAYRYELVSAEHFSEQCRKVASSLGTQPAKEDSVARYRTTAERSGHKDYIEAAVPEKPIANPDPQHLTEDEKVLQSSVSNARKSAFFGSYLADRQTTATTEMLFHRANAFRQEAARPKPEDVSWSGFNVLLRKAPFVDLLNWAPCDSWDFAVAMELHLLARFERALRQAAEGRRGDPVNRKASAVLSALDAMANQLQTKGYAPTAFVLAGPLGTQLAIDMHMWKGIMDYSDPQVKQTLATTFRIFGMYAEVPILDIPESPSPGIYAMDVARFAKLTRYGAQPEFEIEEITPQRASDLLSKNPKLVSNPPAEPGKEEERLRQLQLRVGLRLFETYALTALDSEAVVGCPLTGPVL